MKDSGKYTKKQVEEFVKSQKSYQLFQPQSKPVLLRITAPDVGYVQGDLLDFSKYKGSNNGYSWILAVIDIASRYAWAIPLKNKTAEAVLEGLKQIPAPTNWTSDNGSEFTNSKIKSWFADNNINVYYAAKGDHNKLGIIDRFSRTIRQKITKYMAANDTLNWSDAIGALISGYNNSVHRTIGQKPSAIYSGKKSVPQKSNNSTAFKKLSTIVAGDTVRVLANKGVFSKGTVPIWSDDTYTVTGRQGNKFLLDNGNLYSYNSLLKIPKEVQVSMSSIRKPIKLSDEIKKITRTRKVSNELKRDGIDQKNIIEGSRFRSRKPVLDY
jgi:hypothetical protein